MSLVKQPASLAAARLQRLPQEALDVWELAIVRLPQWVVGEARPPYRPHVVLVASRERDLIGTGDSGAPEDAPKLGFLDALARLAAVRGMGYRPARIAVRDAALVERVRAEVAPLGIDVELASTLPMIDRVASEMLRGFGAEAPVPGYLDGRGVTLEGVRAFADAAAEFVRAAPWNHLVDTDVVHVESPAPNGELEWVALSGSSGEHVGLTFYTSRDDHAEVGEGDDDSPVFDRPRWAIGFEPVHELPLADADLWEDHALPRADEYSVPFFWLSSPRDPVQRPDAAMLAWAEGLLRAFAATTEDELDSGRWRKHVRTIAGERAVDLALPDVLDPPPAARTGDRRAIERVMADLQRAIRERGLTSPEEVNALLETRKGQVSHAEPSTPREWAEEKLASAFDSSGRVRLKLAREAIALWPDCADAWVLRAEAMPDLVRAQGLYEQALAAAERALGPEVFSDEVGQFWVLLETRPYMRALAGLAEVLWERGDVDAAFGHWQELLRLNPADHQGTRLLLVPRLLEESRDDAAGRALAGFVEDDSSILEFSRALLAFRREGAGPLAGAALARATRANPHALKFLVGNADAELVEQDGFYSPGDEREAAMIDEELGVAFEETPGALEWLRGHRRQSKKARETKRRRR